MPDSPLAKIESDIRGFVRASYPDMIVHAEHWKEDPSRIALFFIDEHFKGLYPRQRYHYLVHLIPLGRWFRCNVAPGFSLARF
jgi:hypothetical protein